MVLGVASCVKFNGRAGNNTAFTSLGNGFTEVYITASDIGYPATDFMFVLKYDTVNEGVAFVFGVRLGNFGKLWINSKYNGTWLGWTEIAKVTT